MARQLKTGAAALDGGHADCAGLCRHDRQLHPAAGSKQGAGTDRADNQQQADREATQWEAAYSRMSDQERMRGIVYEPISDRLPETGRTKP